MIKGVVGRWRLWLGYCPWCNLDAPELYGCRVCENYHGMFPVPDGVLAEWRRRWVWIRQTGGVPENTPGL